MVPHNRCRDRVAAFTKSFEAKGLEAPFLFLLNVLLPGAPDVSTVMYWAMGKGIVDGERGDRAGDHHEKFMRMLER